MSPAGTARVLLVGFMGSGKTTVGRRVAERLGWDFVDFDHEVESRERLPVREIFARRGEEAFRRAEAEVAGVCLSRERVVLASGGGWAAVPGRLREVPAGTLSVWLRVSPEEAVRRASGEPGARPLLDRADALEEARRLLARREPHYALAARAVDTERCSVDDVTDRILEFVHDEKGSTDTE